MTEKQREVFIMYYRDCMTQDEISAIVGIAQQNVYKRLRGALNIAKKYLEKY